MQQIMNQSSRERAFLKVEYKRLHSEKDPCVILRMFWSKKIFLSNSYKRNVRNRTVKTGPKDQSV